MFNRRQVLSLAATGAVTWPLAGWSKPSSQNQPLLVWWLLRGALDGLSAVPPWKDANYQRYRDGLVIKAPGHGGGALDLDGYFGLHPNLANLHQWYLTGEMAVMPASASGYRERSHFDGQKVMEYGTGRSSGPSGWLNRCLAGTKGLAVGQNLPVVFHGDKAVNSWWPAPLPNVQEDTIARLMHLYQQDPLLESRLREAAAMQDAAGSMGRRTGRFLPASLVGTAGKLLQQDPAIGYVSIESGGWDTHANQGAASGQLANRLKQLDDGLAALKKSLGPRWADTVVVVTSEFGRTVKANGTRGTDHGTGGVTFLAGGAVRGGRVLGQWPGLGKGQLYQNRDVAPANDIRALLKGVLAEHMGLDSGYIGREVFPKSAPAMGGLIQPSSLAGLLSESAV